mgnify:CR=1 FL=1
MQEKYIQYLIHHGSLQKGDKEVNVKINCKLNGKYCGKCCYNTEMPLTREDIERIVKLGFPEKYFVNYNGQVPKLKNIEGHCVFLDVRTGKCKIYENRPLGCRLYPLVYDAKEDRVTVDKLCPKFNEVSEETIRKYEEYVKDLASRVLKGKLN